MPEISIIMPVYNTAEYLVKSLCSLQQQTYTDFELICVNDASTDDSLAILEEFQKKDNRFVIINHEINCGAACSRNDGLRMARGKYVICLDSDDYFYSNLLEVIHKNAVENDADVVIFGSEIYVKDTMELKKMGYSFQIIDSLEARVLFLPRIRHVPWDKLVKREILLKYQIAFQNILTNEDVLYSFSLMLMAERIVVCDEILLKYCAERPGNLSSMRISKKNYTVEAFYAIYQFILRNNIEEQLKTIFMNILSDNIQKYLSDNMYSIQMRQESLKILLGYQNLIDSLERYSQKKALYPHNRKFVEKLIKGENVCNVGYYEYYSESIADIILEKNNLQKKIALWGCGQNGKKLLHIMRQAKLSVDYVVDENKAIQGTLCGEYIIYSYDRIADNVDTIFITNLEYKKEIEKRTKGKEVLYVWK